MHNPFISTIVPLALSNPMEIDYLNFSFTVFVVAMVQVSKYYLGTTKFQTRKSYFVYPYGYYLIFLKNYLRDSIMNLLIRAQ